MRPPGHLIVEAGCWQARADVWHDRHKRICIKTRDPSLVKARWTAPLLSAMADGATGSLQALVSISDSAERDEAERNVKKRVLGNMRLMSELYKQEMVKDWIMVTCIDELLLARATKGAKVPPEDNIEVRNWGGVGNLNWPKV